MILQEINLSISSVCNASCLFCPTPNYPMGQEKFMSVEMVNLILAEIRDPQFRAKYPQLTHSVIGENGEPFCNPNAVEIMRIWRAAKVFGEIAVYTNASLMTEEISRAILKERLIDNLHVNMDGLTNESYIAVKRIPIFPAKKNLERFIQIREELKAPIRIVVHVITHTTYRMGVQKKFGIIPMKWKDVQVRWDQEEDEIKNYWWSLLRSPDYVGADDLFFWAERKNDSFPIDYEHLSCPQLARLKSCAYINPSGDWYACCFDRDNCLVLGNILEETIEEIAEGEAKRKLIKQLECKEFSQIGLPCARVDCCQGMSLNDVRGIPK